MPEGTLASAHGDACQPAPPRRSPFGPAGRTAAQASIEDGNRSRGHGMFMAIRVVGPRSLLLLCPAACMLAACSGGSGDAEVATGSTVGVWTGTLTPDDPSQTPTSGWLTVAENGGFQLDTDAALFTGTAQTQGGTLTAATTAHPYGGDFPAGSAFTFDGTIAKSVLTGKWSGGGRTGTMNFQHDDAVSRQAASLSALASTYEGELWVGNAVLPASIAINPDGSFTASASGGCTASGTVGIADAARNRYQWTATLSGCGADGSASGSGFMVGDYSVYLSGTMPDAAVWMGGVDADVPRQ